jgi:hypothetical protein
MMGHLTSRAYTNVLKVFVAVLVATTAPLLVWSLSPAGDPTSGEQPAVSPAEQGASSAQTPEAQSAEQVQERAVPQLKVTPSTPVGSPKPTTPSAPGTTTINQAQLLLQQRQAEIYSGKFLTSGGQIPVPKGMSFVAGLRNQLAQEARLVGSLRTTDPIVNKSSPEFKGLNAHNPPPGILSVNGKTSGFLLTPGQPVIVKGVSFGASTGRLVMRGLPNGDIDLSVADWNDKEIVALVPATLRGVPDGVIMVVVVKAAQQWQHPGGTFYAARQDYTVQGAQALRFHKIQFATINPEYGVNPQEHVGSFVAPSTTGLDSNEVTSTRYYYHSGNDSSTLDLSCWSPGTDYLTTIDPGHGFVVTGLSLKWYADDLT